MDYKEINDYEAIYMVNEDSEQAYTILYEKYKNVVLKLAKKYYKHYLNTGIDMNDLILEGYMGLDKAIKSFNNNHNIKFQSFLFLCVERQIIGLIRNSTTKKNHTLNNSLYYEELLDENDALEIIEDPKSINPEKYIVDSEKRMNMINNVYKHLKGIEFQVFILKLDGLSNKEISEILNKDIKSINNALNRIRKKKNIININ